MDIDIVYTWVNSNDTAWQETRKQFAKEEVGENFAYRAGESRFRDNNELKYSLRSLKFTVYSSSFCGSYWSCPRLVKA